MKSYQVSVSRYPIKNNSSETGKNIIALDGKAGSRARQINLTVVGERPEVLINGSVLLPERICGNIHHYFSRQVVQALTEEGKKEYGKIESAVVNGEDIEFNAKISY